MSVAADFCTYFDSGYLPRGLALYHSLRQHAPTATLHVLALDDETHCELTRLSLPHLNVIRLDNFEEGDEAMLAAKSNRSRIEYYFTCTPKLPLYVLDCNPHLELVFYVDADFYFFGPAQVMIDELGSGSIYVVEHRFPEELHALEEHGRFNVGVLGFRNDNNARHCLSVWKNQCTSWCYDRVEEGKFADQKYLDAWPDTFGGVVISRHNGVNVAPWNKSRFKLRCHLGSPYVDERPVICVHYHGLKFHPFGIVEPQCEEYGNRLSTGWLRVIYRPYLIAIRRTKKLLRGTRHSPPRFSTSLSIDELIRVSPKKQLLFVLGPVSVELPPRLLRLYLLLCKKLSKAKDRLFHRAVDKASIN